MSDQFYRAFEERYYAPRKVIRRLRQQYLPYVAPLAVIYPGTATFDLGCGRGEWLELMIESGFDAQGVDLDAGMLAACRELGLPANMGDAVAHLSTLPDNSHAVVSAFHVVEHISFEQLTQVVINALRVLKPGGLLIMETPNPENIVVGTQNFYLDPTHQRPIPSQLLSFLTEHYGYARTQVLRLQESREILTKTQLGLHDVLNGVSPDYAVIAQKSAIGGVLDQFDELFSRQRGLSLETLSSHYDASIRAPMARVQTSLKELEHRVHSVSSHSKEHLAALETRLHRLEATALRAEQAASEAGKALEAVCASTSWRVTAPMRWLGIQLKLLRQHGLKARLSSLQAKIRRDQTEADPASAATKVQGASKATHHDPATEFPAPLSVRAQQAYVELKTYLHRSSSGN